jgi:hypothetical protein
MTLSPSDAQHGNALPYAECHYGECHILLTITLSVIMLNVVMLNVIMLNVVAPPDSGEIEIKHTGVLITVVKSLIVQAPTLFLRPHKNL